MDNPNDFYGLSRESSIEKWRRAKGQVVALDHPLPNQEIPVTGNWQIPPLQQCLDLGV
jgi:hypothetical protein